MLFNYDKSTKSFGFGNTGLGGLFTNSNANILKQGDNQQFLNQVINGWSNATFDSDKIAIVASQYKDVNAELVQYVQNAKNLGVAQQDLEQGWINQGKAVGKFKLSLKSLGDVAGTVISSIGNMLASFGLSLLVSQVIKQVSKLINMLHITKKEAAEAASSFRDSFSSMLEKQGNTSKTIAELEEEFTELSKGVDGLGRNVGLTEEQFTRYHEITQTIADNIPSLIDGYDAQGRAIIRLKGDVESLSDAYRDASMAEAYQEYNKEDENGTRIAKAAYKDINNFFGQRYLEIGSERQLSFNEIRDTYQRLAQMDYEDAMKLVDDYSNYLEQTLFQNAGIYSDMTKEEFDNEAHAKLLRQYNDFESELVVHNKTLSDLAYGYAKSIPNYWDESLDAAREYFDYVLSHMDYDLALDLNLVGEDGKVNEDAVNNFIVKATDELRQLQKDHPEATDKIETRFNVVTEFNNNQVTYGEYLKVLQDTESWMNDLPADVQKMLRFIFNIESEGNVGDKGSEWLKKLMGDGYTDDFASTLKAEDWEKILDITIRYTDDTKNAEMTDRIMNSKLPGGMKNLAMQAVVQYESDPYSEQEIRDQLIADINPIEIEAKVTAVDAVDSMADAKAAITSLEELWNQTVQESLSLGKDKKYLDADGNVIKQLNDKNQAVGFADPETINNVEQAFKSFIQTASDSGKDITDMNLALEEFEKTMVEQPGNAEAAQKAINHLITAYIDQTDIIKNLTEANAEWSIEQLKAYGVTNAKDVVISRLNTRVKQLAKQFAAAADSIKALNTEMQGSEKWNTAMGNVQDNLNETFSVKRTASMGEEQEFSPSFSQDWIVENLDMITEAANGSYEAIYALEKEAAKRIAMQVEIDAPDAAAVDGVLDQVNALIDAFPIDTLEVGTSLDTNPMIQGLNSLVDAGKITRDSMNAILASIGVEPTITWEDVPISATSAGAVQDAYSKLPGGYEAGKNMANAVANGTIGTVKIPKIGYAVTSKGVGAQYASPSSGSSSSGGGGGGGGGGSEPTKPKEESEESFDWIEVAIQRIEEEIARLDKVVGNSYDLWIHRNEALLKEINKTKEEIKAQEIAYKEYLRNANEVKVNNGKGLNPDDYGENDSLVKAQDQRLLTEAQKAWATGEYQKKVREGLMTGKDIETIQNHFLSDAIKQYQEL